MSQANAVNVSKLNAYAVLSDAVLKASKLNAYVVLQNTALQVSKLNAYAVLSVPSAAPAGSPVTLLLGL